MPPFDSTAQPLEPDDATSKATRDAIQEDKAPIPENISSRLYQAIEAKNFQGALPLVIKEGFNNTLFQAIPGQEPTVNSVTPKQLALIEKAIVDPQGSKGAVRMYVGNEKAFHVKDGQVITDELGLTQQQTRTQSASQLFAEAKPTIAQALKASVPSLQDQITALTAVVDRQQKQIDALNQRLDKLVDSPVFVVVANEKLNNWFSNVRSKVQKAGQSAVAQVSDKLEQNKAALVSKTQEFLASVKESVTDTLHAALNNVQAQAGEMTLGAMNAATAKLASVIGEKLPDGSFVIESRDRNQRLEVSGNNVALQSRPQLDAQALWNNYSQGIPQDRPIQRTLAVAQNAMRDGMTRTAVEDLLRADPQFQKVQQDQGLNKAQEYAKQMTRSASRREQQALEPQQQQRSLFQSQSNGLQQ